jgi:host factor-I protein
VAGKISNAKAPAQTLRESGYLQDLINNRVPVRVHLEDHSELEGTIEFYDARFLRLTREGEPNVFVYKHEIVYIYELGE